MAPTGSSISGLFTDWVLENPYPLAVIGIVVGICMLWASRGGGQNRQRLSGLVAIGIAALLLLIGALVETAGEEAELLTEQLVEDAVAGDVDAVLDQFAANAGFGLSSPKSAPFAVEVVGDQVRSLVGRYSIQSNRITRLSAYTISGDKAEVRFSCSTDTGDGFATPTTWIAEYERQDDGELKIVRLTWMSVMGNKPSLSFLLH